jgi:two-component system, NtrC family, response regulator HydG
MNVLVVDDICITRALLRQMVTTAGHNAVEAGGVQEALTALTENPIDLVITDLTMPDGDGIAVLEAAINTTSPPPVVLFTASVDEKVLSFAKAAGFSKVLKKPLTAQRVSEMLAVCKP